MLEVVEDKDRLSVSRFYQVIQCLQLFIVQDARSYILSAVVLHVDFPTGHLQKHLTQNACICGQNVVILHT